MLIYTNSFVFNFPLSVRTGAHILFRTGMGEQKKVIANCIEMTNFSYCGEEDARFYFYSPSRREKNQSKEYIMCYMNSMSQRSILRNNSLHNLLNLLENIRCAAAISCSLFSKNKFTFTAIKSDCSILRDLSPNHSKVI